MNFKVTKYPHGTFSWADCSSSDFEASKNFYTAVFGWTAQDLPLGDGMFYTMFSQDGLNVAGLGPLQPQMQEQGMMSVWNCYVSVDDVDALQEKVTELGGTVLVGPFDVFDNGRMMTLQDPSGAVVSLWQPINHIGSSLVNIPGAMTWNELSTRDPQAATEFFSKLLGWTFEDDTRPDYKMIQNKGRMNGGMITMDEAWEGLPPHWMVYFSVANIEETLEKVKSSGGAVKTPLIEAPGVGRFAVISDPAGAHLTAMQLENPQPWIE